MPTVKMPISNKNYIKNAQCYGQFSKLKDWSQKLLLSVRRTELKEPKLLKAVRPSEMQLIRLIEWVRRTFCIAIDFTTNSSAEEMINRFINLKLTNISTFNYEFTIIKH